MGRRAVVRACILGFCMSVPRGEANLDAALLGGEEQGRVQVRLCSPVLL
jgi:hypothetical protein